MELLPNTVNLVDSFKKWKAMTAEEQRREQRISELMQPYLKNDDSEKVARAKAEADYLKIHNHEH